MLAALNAGGDGAVICKVIVTDYVSDTSPDCGLPSVFRINDVHGKKQKWNCRSLQRAAELQKESERMREHQTREMIAVVVPDSYTHADMYQIARGRRHKQTLRHSLWGDENNLPM